MPLSLLELFRVLSSFSPRRVDLSRAPWEEYVPWAISQGLAPLAAYNLEYRLGRADAPEWAVDRLLSVYQGSANDNVMKLVHFKRTVDELEGRRIVVLGGASFAESLYPHVAFRPVIDVRLLVPRADVEPFAGYLRRAAFKPDDAPQPGVDRVLTDGRTALLLHGSLVGDAAEDEGVFRRALPMRVYGPSVFRLALEDALLAQVLLMARAGFDVPLLELVDLRELVTGAKDLGGDYSRPVDAEAVLRRAKVWGVERALWAALTAVARLFPEAEGAVRPLLPALLLPTRELLDRLAVAPLAEPGRARAALAEAPLRALLAGG